MRMKCKTKNDGRVGWVTAVGNTGTVPLLNGHFIAELRLRGLSLGLTSGDLAQSRQRETTNTWLVPLLKYSCLWICGSLLESLRFT